MPAVTLSDLPALNATLNATSGVLLVIGYILIRRGRVRQHRAVMIARLRRLGAVPDVVRHLPRATSARSRSPATGRSALVYFTILLTHVVLAAAVPPLALITLVARAARHGTTDTRDRAMDVSDLAVRVGHRRDRLLMLYRMTTLPFDGLRRVLQVLTGSRVRQALVAGSVQFSLIAHILVVDRSIPRRRAFSIRVFCSAARRCSSPGCCSCSTSTAAACTSSAGSWRGCWRDLALPDRSSLR